MNNITLTGLSLIVGIGITLWLAWKLFIHEILFKGVSFRDKTIQIFVCIALGIIITGALYWSVNNIETGLNNISNTIHGK